MAGTALIGGAVLVGLVLLVVLFKLMWRVDEPNEALIISGLRSSGDNTISDNVEVNLGFKIITGKGTLVLLLGRDRSGCRHRRAVGPPVRRPRPPRGGRRGNQGRRARGQREEQRLQATVRKPANAQAYQQTTLAKAERDARISAAEAKRSEVELAAGAVAAELINGAEATAVPSAAKVVVPAQPPSRPGDGPRHS